MQPNLTSSSRGALISMALMGTGLMILGATLFAMYANQSSDMDYSTVPAAVNYAAPNLELTDLSSARVSLQDYRGQVALVNLWATWCPPCKAEMPTLKSFYENYKDRGFVVIGIDDGESADVVTSFVNDYGLTFPIWLDEKYVTEETFGTMQLPTSWVIDRQGRVVFTWVGAISRKMLEKYVVPVIEG